MIDKGTVQQILDAVDIVDVVSDFVSLKRRGANYVGLCPFHNEKTPSFSVSKSKGICKCFSCGKGGSAVNFVMEHEQISYYEALKYLANKYHIEIKERQLSAAELEAQSERESMLFINEFACNFFEKNLLENNEGREIGLSYFYERGINDVSIKKFHLGYSLLESDSLYKATMKEGLSEKYLFETGLCMKSQHGNGGYDRFKGRVMFPVLNLAGKIIAFGGRTLKKDPAKYVNSPESIIYKKSNELYGLFQAKKSIEKNAKCFLVEGYTDVISMVQSGIENVVASSGTSLTEGQIRKIHRFTENVTVLYDGDSAGIKASLRGIDMLLAEGLNIKVLLLPEGEDPDSFARSHSASEFQQYIDENETDFIKFKTKILLEGVESDPIKRSHVVRDIVESIAVIPFMISQNIYTKECSRLLDIDEQVLAREVAKSVAALKQKEFDNKQRVEREKLKEEYPIDKTLDAQQHNDEIKFSKSNNAHFLRPYEFEVMRFVVRYGMASFCLDDSEHSELTVLEYIQRELLVDQISFVNEDIRATFDASVKVLPDFRKDYSIYLSTLQESKLQQMNEGFKNIQGTISDISSIQNEETALEKRIDEELRKKAEDYCCAYLEKGLCSCENDIIRKLSLNIVSDKYKLSKIHTKFSHIPSEYSRLRTLIPNAINNLKNGIVTCRIKEVQEQLSKNPSAEVTESLLKELKQLYDIQVEFSTILGERVVNPRLRMH